MKKTNNKYRNNNSNNYNNQIYSLNYKFDSISPAGKCSGTALDLIKKYNELAKEAHGNNDYVEAEVFRQYAEHYRKIVTDINEKKAQRPQQQFNKAGEKSENVSDNLQNSDNINSENNNTAANDGLVETRVVETKVIDVANDTANNVPAEKREFKVIEISPSDSKAELIENAAAKSKTPRTPRRKTAVV